MRRVRKHRRLYSNEGGRGTHRELAGLKESRETEATEKSSKHSKPVPGSSVGGREAEDTITR
jgi:hypothetical protein